MSDELKVSAGTLLAAWPDLMDPNFMHSVVLICQHSSDGAYGLVSNRTTDLVLQDLLPDHPVLGSSTFPVFLGGPVDHSTLQILHRVPDEIPDGVCLDGEIWLGGDLEAMAAYVAREPEKARAGVRVLLGYSGWGGGQLEAELEAGSWLPAPPSTAILFGAEGETAWREVVRSVGRDGSGLQDLPPDVSWN